MDNIRTSYKSTSTAFLHNYYTPGGRVLTVYKYHCNDCDKFFNLLSELQEHVKVTEHYDYELIELKAQIA